MRGDIVYSNDAGASWARNSVGQLADLAFGSFDPVSGGGAFFVNQYHPRTLFEVANESSPPRSVGTMPNGNYWFSLTFTNRNQGVALSQGPGGSYPDLLWHTNDGGSQWNRVRL